MLGRMDKTSDWKQALDLDRAAWRKQLEEYVEDGDRDIEPVFVGRREQFDAVDIAVSKARRGKHGNLTLAIGGAPGAGKSAFITAASRKYLESGMAVPITLKPDQMGPVALVKRLSKVLVQEMPEDTSKTIGTTAGGGIAGFVEAKASTSETKVEPGVLQRAQREETVPWETISEVFRKRLNGRPILLFVDEAQRFRRIGTAHDNIPYHLHEGADEDQIPIVPVYCGLADTGHVLRTEAGLTRLAEANMLSLGALGTSESRQCVREITREYLRLTGQAHQVAALHEWMLDNADNWPQHLRSQNAALAEVMLAANSKDIGDLSLDNLRTRVAERRNAFYASRADNVYDGEFTGSMLAVMKYAGSAPGGAEKSEMIARARQSLAGEAECNAQPRAFVDQMIHAGMLQNLPASTRYHAPIPSMQDWLEHDRHIVPEIDLHRIRGGNTR